MTPKTEVQKNRLLAVFSYLAIFSFFSTLAVAPAHALLSITAVPLVTPNDPLYQRQSHLTQIQAPRAWGMTTGSVRTTVAVIDSGVDVNHPDLRENIWVNPGEIPGDGIDNDNDGYIDNIYGWDFVAGVPDPSPKFTNGFRAAGIHHGTLIAGIIAGRGNNGLGITGVSWRAKILPLRVLDGNGDGDVINVIRAIDFAIAKKVDVINLSFVGEFDSALFRDAIRRARDAGILVVAATGNDAENNGRDLKEKPVYPACYGRENTAVLGVGSVDWLGQKAPFSNFGECVDIFAPGMGFLSTLAVNYDNGFDSFYGSGWSGTSLSTAVVSGAAALVKAANPALDGPSIRSVLLSSCVSVDELNPFHRARMGCGQLNVEQAVSLSLAHAKVPTPSPEGGVSVQQLFVYPLNGEKSGIFADHEGKTNGRTPFAPFRAGIPYSVTHLKSGQASYFVAGAGRGERPTVRIFEASGRLVLEFDAYDPRFRGGIDVAVGDVNGDGVAEIVTVPLSGGGPHVKIFDQFGALRQHFFAYHPSFREGLSVALGDLNNDGIAEIAVAPQKKSRGDVRIFTADGRLTTQFFAYPESGQAGSQIALGDLDGDGALEIITAPRTSRGPVKIFSAVGRLKSSFYPFDPRFAGGISLAVADVTNDRRPNIIVAPESAGGAQVRVFTGEGRVLTQFFAWPNFRKGIGVVVVD